MSNTERIQANNEALQECIDIAKSLPEAGEGGIPEGYYDASGITTQTSDVRKGKEFINEDGRKVGTMTEYSNEEIDHVLNVMGYPQNPDNTYYPIPNGYHDYSGYVSIDPEAKTATPTKSAQDITPTDGKVLYKVTMNPIPDEYIIPEGTKPITANGTYDVAENATVEVNVPIPDGYIQPSGVLEITENGTHDVAEFASVNVNVEASGGDPTALLDAALNNTLTSIDSNVTSIVGYACRGLSKLKTVNLPNATSIGTYAFYYCTSMTSINAPKVTSLGTYSFYNCGAIKSVNFPLATTIAQNCFYSCGALERADFGTAGTINQAALAYCDNLKTLILRKSNGICKLATATNALQGSAIANGTGYVYVPKAYLSDDDATMDYRRATNWSNYASQFRAIEDYPEICG